MRFRVIGEPQRVAGVSLRGALDASGKLWLCEVSLCGNFIEPVFGPVKEDSISSDNPSNGPYIEAARTIFRGMKGYR